MPEATAPIAPPVPFGQALGEASRDANALLLRLLDREDVTFLQWVVMNTIATSDAPVIADDLSAHLSQELSIDAAEVEPAFSTLRSSGRIDTDGGVLTFTDDGRAYHHRLRQAVAGLTAELLGGLDPAEIATTIKVLRTIHERAPKIAVG
jgi:DNA-binding MarR family transcriptional regulator